METPPAGSDAGRSRLAGAALAALTLAAYGNGLRGPFVFDDRDSIVNNLTIRRLWPPWSALAAPGNSTVHGRPVLNLSFAVNYAISGLSSWSYHALNLAIHVCAGLALFGIVRRTLRRPALRDKFRGGATTVAFLSALLWLLHPVQSQSVTYVVQRAESLMGLFYLLTLYGFVRGTEEGASRGWLVLSWAACFLGMGTKETMATAPILVLLYDRTFTAGTFLGALRKRIGYYGALAATWSAFLPVVLAGGRRDPTSGWGVGIPWWGYVRTQFHAVAHYVRIAFWPAGMRLYYERGGRIDFSHQPGISGVLPYAIAVLALAAATLWALRRRPAIGFLGAWFFVILAPTSVVPGASDIMADRRLYLPLAAIAVLAVCALHRRAGRRSVPALVAVALVLGLVTGRCNAVFASETAFWQSQVNGRPDDPLALMNLGNAYMSGASFGRAVLAYTDALKLDPYFVYARYGLGAAYEHEGDYDESATQYRFALDLAERNIGGSGALVPGLENLLGHALLAANRPAEALYHLHQALRYDHNNPVLHYYAGVADGLTGQYSDASRELQTALRLDPGYQPARDLLDKLAAGGVR